MARRSRKKALFRPARHKWLAKIITFKSVTEAKKAASALVKKAKRAPRKKASIIKKALVLAANRAKASRRRHGLRRATKKRLRRIEEVYREAYKSIKLS